MYLLRIYTLMSFIVQSNRIAGLPAIMTGGRYVKQHVKLGEYYPHNQTLACRLIFPQSGAQFFNHLEAVLPATTYPYLESLKYRIGGVCYDQLALGSAQCSYLWQLHQMTDLTLPDGRHKVQLPIMIGLSLIDPVGLVHELCMYFSQAVPDQTQEVEIWADVYTFEPDLYQEIIDQRYHTISRVTETETEQLSLNCKKYHVQVNFRHAASDIVFHFGPKHQEYIRYLDHVKSHSIVLRYLKANTHE